MMEQSVELRMIDMDKSLSAQVKCFKTIISFVPFMFPYTDYQPVPFCTYMAVIWVSFHFLDLKLEKQIPHVLMYKKNPHS